VLGDLVEDRFLLRKSAGREFGVDQFAVNGELEAAAAGGDELVVLDLLLEGAEQFGRQTDGLGFVVSHGAVFEFQMHVCLLSLDACRGWPRQ